MTHHKVNALVAFFHRFRVAYIGHQHADYPILDHNLLVVVVVHFIPNRIQRPVFRLDRVRLILDHPN